MLKTSILLAAALAAPLAFAQSSPTTPGSLGSSSIGAPGFTTPSSIATQPQLLPGTTPPPSVLGNPPPSSATGPTSVPSTGRIPIPDTTLPGTLTTPGLSTL